MISTYFLLLSFALMINYTLTQIPCRHGDHKMLALLTENKSILNPVGLEQFDYNFLLLSSYDNKNNYQIAFKGYFPINSNIDLNLNTIYQFIPEEYCLNHLIKNSVSTLKGNLTEYYSNKTVLTKTFVNFEKMLLNSPINSIEKQKNQYYLMTRVNCRDASTEVVLMKTLFEENGAFSQFVKATLSYLDKENENSNDGVFIEAGTALLIKPNNKNEELNHDAFDYSAKEFGMKSGGFYTSILQVGSLFKYIKFDKVENLLCLKGRNMDTFCNAP